MTALQEGQCARLRKAIGARVNQLTNIQDAQKALYKALHSAVKERFGVSSYQDIEPNYFLQALQFIEQWE